MEEIVSPASAPAESAVSRMPVVSGERTWGLFTGSAKYLNRILAVVVDVALLARLKQVSDECMLNARKHLQPEIDGHCGLKGCPACATPFIVFVPAEMEGPIPGSYGGYTVFMTPAGLLGFQRVAFLKAKSGRFGAVRRLAGSTEGVFLLVPHGMLIGWNESVHAALLEMEEQLLAETRLRMARESLEQRTAVEAAKEPPRPKKRERKRRGRATPPPRSHRLLPAPASVAIATAATAASVPSRPPLPPSRRATLMGMPAPKLN